MRIVLADNQEIQLAEATYDGHYVVSCQSRAEYQSIWDKFTAENLSDFKLYDGDNLVKRVLYIRLSSTQAILNPDNMVTGHFYFTGGTEVPNEYEEAGRILLGEDEV